MKRETKKMIDRMMSVLLVLTMIFCLAGCGNATPAIGEDVVVSIEESGEAIEESSGEGDTEGTKEKTEIKDGEEAGAGGEEKPAVTASPEPTAEPTPTPTPEPTPIPEHVHQYTETITRQPSCSEAGEKTLICSCGDSKTETLPTTSQHNWVEGSVVVHHEALGHVSVTETQVQVGTTTRTEYECANCGARFNTPEEKTEHCKATGDFTHAMARTIAHDYSEPVYETRTENVWVVDQEAWDETVGSGTYTCTVCGATK